MSNYMSCISNENFQFSSLRHAKFFAPRRRLLWQKRETEMGNFGMAILRGLGSFLAWVGRAIVTIIRTLLEESVRGVFGLLRPILPWAVGAAIVLLLMRFAPETAEAIIVLIILGLVLKMMLGKSPKKKK